MSGVGEGKVVCVTGASGFIASWIVKLLLERGYTVKATVRDPNDPNKTEHLRTLNGARERLHLFKANLVEVGAFDPVVDGCEGVFHTASPVSFSTTINPNELLEPAVKGTINVLKSCAKVPTIKRVVVTSSMAAVTVNGKPLANAVVDEEKKLWYMLSKTLAENAAWKFANENGIDLVTINPGWVIGPFLQSTLNLTVESILNCINGQTFVFANEYLRFVDVRDVAYAHILAFERPSASGRYCLVGEVMHFSEFSKILHQYYPTLHLPEKCSDDKPFVPTYEVSKEKVKTLGLDYTPLEVTAKHTIECLKERGFLSN